MALMQVDLSMLNILVETSMLHGTGEVHRPCYKYGGCQSRLLPVHLVAAVMIAKTAFFLFFLQEVGTVVAREVEMSKSIFVC